MTAAFVPARRPGLVGGLRSSFALTWRSLLKIPAAPAEIAGRKHSRLEWSA